MVLPDASGGELLEAAGGESFDADMAGDEWLDIVLGGCWTSMKLARTLERGRWAGSDRLRRELGDRPRAWESSRSLAAALFSNSDRRFRTAEEDRGSGMAFVRERGSNQLESARRMTFVASSCAEGAVVVI